MSRIRFEDTTPINKGNLNKLNNVVISPTEPTTGEEVWIDNTNKKIYTKNDNGVYEEFYNEENLKRKILWTNPNPTSSFGGQTITTSKDYTMYSVVYAVKISGYYYYMSTGILPYDLRASLQSVGEGAMRRRNIESISLGNFVFNVCRELGANVDDNSDCIPVQIIGYN